MTLVGPSDGSLTWIGPEVICPDPPAYLTRGEFGLSSLPVPPAGARDVVHVGTLATEIDLPLRLRFAPMCMPGADRAFLDHIIDQQRIGGRRWQVEGVKFMIDGTIDGGTAWLDHPDSHGESTAPFWPEPQAYTEAARYLAAAGVPTVTHAIGDAGVRYVLDGLSGIPAERSRVPHRVEHIETIPADLVDRFRRLDVTASMQPTHCTLYTKADHSDNWSERLGTQRANRAFRCRDLRDAGARLALGSDWPIAPFDPRGVIADAQLRRPHRRTRHRRGPARAVADRPDGPGGLHHPRGRGGRTAPHRGPGSRSVTGPTCRRSDPIR